MVLWENTFWTLFYIFLFILGILVTENLIRSALHKRVEIIPEPVPREGDGLIFAGHATILFKLAGTVVLTDPSLTSNYFFFFRRFHTLGLRLEDLSKVDIVVISHSHADHNHPASLRLLARHNKQLTLIVPQGYGKKYKYEKRYGFAQVIQVRQYQSVHVKNLVVTNVPADHFYSPNASGWIFEKDSLVPSKSVKTIYFAGDTAYNQRMFQDIGSRFNIDIAFLPIGCFEGRMFFGLLRPSFARVHMSPRDLSRAISDLHCKRVIPIHWGTFIIGCEGPNVAPTLLKKLQNSREVPSNVQLVTPGRWQNLDLLISR